jgi:predicted esterase
MRSLEVVGHRAAVLAVPRGVRRPVPLYVVLHGNFDRPEWQCEVWRGIVGDGAFVLCPRGVPRSDVAARLDRWTYAALARTEAEVEAAVSALESELGAYLAPGKRVLAGFSLGASHAAGLLRKRARGFIRAVLIEGGDRAWAGASAKAYAAQGGVAVLFGCAQSVCRARAAQAAKTLEAAGIAAKVADAGDVGHTYDGRVAEVVAAELDWLWKQPRVVPAGPSAAAAVHGEGGVLSASPKSR